MTTTPVTAATRARSARLPWADVAKGGSILLVVLHHVVTKQLPLVASPELAWATDGWLAVTSALKPVRMPLFFVVSGFFAARAVTRPWSEVRRRALAPYYLYVVWLVPLAAFFSVHTALPMNRTRDLGELGQDLLLASTGLWFLYALAAYFVLAKVTASLPAPVVLGAAVGLALAAGALPIDEANRVAVLVHFVYFVVGARFSDMVREMATGRFAVQGAPLTVALLALVLAVELASLPLVVRVLVVSLLGVPWALWLAVRASRVGWLQRGLAGLGRRTLPVYVLHVPLLSLLHSTGLHGPDGAGTSAAVQTLVLPLVVTAVLVVASLAVHIGLRRLGLGLLFELPGRRVRSSTRKLERVLD